MSDLDKCFSTYSLHVLLHKQRKVHRPHRLISTLYWRWDKQGQFFHSKKTHWTRLQHLSFHVCSQSPASFCILPGCPHISALFLGETYYCFVAEYQISVYDLQQNSKSSHFVINITLEKCFPSLLLGLYKYDC